MSIIPIILYRVFHFFRFSFYFCMFEKKGERDKGGKKGMGQKEGERKVKRGEGQREEGDG